MRTFNHNYPSDITREQYEVIREELEYTKRKTKPSITQQGATTDKRVLAPKYFSDFPLNINAFRGSKHFDNQTVHNQTLTFEVGVVPIV